jgi:hydrogenase/urease accessory protein HupE
VRGVCRVARGLVSALLAVAVTAPAAAHEMRTGFLEVSLRSPGTALVRWSAGVVDETVELRFPAGCEAQLEARHQRGSLFSLRCAEPLEGRSIAVTGLGPVIGEVVARVQTVDGLPASFVLTPGSAVCTIPASRPWTAVLLECVPLGFRHVLIGWDHLLFLWGLALLLRRPRQLFAAAGAFALAHGLTLSLAALGLLRLSQPAAEACIALSLLLLALDLPGTCAGVPTARALGTAFIFGLVHGLGFAGALREALGAAPEALIGALIGFHLGIELAQAGVLILVLGLLRALRSSRMSDGLLRASPYLVGVPGAYWLLARLAPG